MASPDIYTDIVMPFMDAAEQGGISKAQISELIGVSRSTPYFWKRKRFAPDKQMQDKLLQLTQRIITATNQGILPIHIDLDVELRKRLDWYDDDDDDDE